jgi:hypothetical protein
MMSLTMGENAVNRILALTLLVLVAGCSVTPSCDSDDAKQLAREIVSEIPARMLKKAMEAAEAGSMGFISSEVFNEMSNFFDMHFRIEVGELSNVRTIAKDQELGRVECRANVVLSQLEATEQQEKDLDAMSPFAKGFVIPYSRGLLNAIPYGETQDIEYSVQITEDGNIYVEVADVTGFEGW